MTFAHNNFQLFPQGQDIDRPEGDKHTPESVAAVEDEEGKRAADKDSEWELVYSDEEMEDPQNWMPPPAEIKRLYELLAKGEMLQLNFEPLPRRPPTPERPLSPEREEEDEEADERERKERERKSVRWQSFPGYFSGIIDFI